MVVSDWRSMPTTTSTARSTGTSAQLATVASLSSVSGRGSAIGAFGSAVDVDREREHRHVEDERRLAEAHERERDAGQRNDGEVAGYGDRELAQREDDPRHADPAHERLRVVVHPARDANEARLAARRLCMSADDFV